MSTHPDTDTFIYDGAPDTLAWWGVKGILRNLQEIIRAVTLTWVDAAEVQNDIKKPHLAFTGLESGVPYASRRATRARRSLHPSFADRSRVAA